MSDNHSRFLEHLSASEGAVWRVAQWMQSRGHPVSFPISTKAEKAEDWKDHADNGDLYISQRIEVKHLSAEFTDRNDWPYGNDYIVCARHSYDNAKPKPYAYIHLNKAQTHAGIVMTTTDHRWMTVKRTDRRYDGVEQEVYLCPLDEVRFVKL